MNTKIYTIRYYPRSHSRAKRPKAIDFQFASERQADMWFEAWQDTACIGTSARKLYVETNPIGNPITEDRIASTNELESRVFQITTVCKFDFGSSD